MEIKGLAAVLAVFIGLLGYTVVEKNYVPETEAKLARYQSTIVSQRQEIENLKKYTVKSTTSSTSTTKITSSISSEPDGDTNFFVGKRYPVTVLKQSTTDKVGSIYTVDDCYVYISKIEDCSTGGQFIYFDCICNISVEEHGYRHAITFHLKDSTEKLEFGFPGFFSGIGTEYGEQSFTGNNYIYDSTKIGVGGILSPKSTNRIHTYDIPNGIGTIVLDVFFSNQS